MGRSATFVANSSNNPANRLMQQGTNHHLSKTMKERDDLMIRVKNLEEELKLVSRSCNELYVYDRKLKLLNKLNIKNKHNEGSLLIRRNDVMKILNRSIKQEVLLNESTETSKVSDTVIKFDATGIFSSNNSHINTKTIGIRGISKISDEIFNHLNLFCFNFCHLVSYPLTNNEFAFTFITNDEIKNKEWSKELETRDFEKIDSVLPKILSMGLLTDFAVAYHCNSNLINPIPVV